MFDPLPYKAILMDLGGVFFYFDWDRFCADLARTSTTHTEGQIKKVLNDGLLHSYEIGKINGDTFYSELQRLAGFTQTPQDFRTALTDCIAYPEAIALLPALAQLAPLILASNTNEAHAAYIAQYPHFAQYFSDMHFSFNIGVNKPRAAFYTSILDKHNLNPSEVLFVDDLLVNLQGARAVGLHVLQYRQPEDLAQLLPTQIAGSNSFSYT